MAVLRIDIERELDELIAQEEGTRFQRLAVVLGKQRWPELIAQEPKKDFGLDAYAAPGLTPEGVGKGLAASITPKQKKISDDAKTAKEHFPDLRMLLFFTPGKIGNTVRRNWEASLQKEYGLELHIIEREEIVALLMVPANASLCASFLRLHVPTEPQIADLIDRTRRAADAVTQTWTRRIKGYPLIPLTALQLDPDGASSSAILTLAEVDQALSESRRLILEGPAGRGKTTTLVQLAQRSGNAGIRLIVQLPAWTSSRRGILEYIGAMPAFQAEGLTAADLARVKEAEPFLFLLNGWNEVSESSSDQAHHALRELERDFPSSGIIVATRAYHLRPPLPGATRLRLIRLRRAQRADYLATRLGKTSAELLTQIAADPSLDDLTRTPFILSEVASLFEAGSAIPSTKIGILTEVLRLQEQRDEHRNALHAAPMFARQTDYLKALATEMTMRGSVTLSEPDSRGVTADVSRRLAEQGQIAPVAAPAILATLTAHHVLEHLDYPQAAIQFEHQQLQEYYAALDVRSQLLNLPASDHDARASFTAHYVNDPSWAEPLRMIAQTLAEASDKGKTAKSKTAAGRILVEMALSVDFVFAGELAQLCGKDVWKEVRALVGTRLRDTYSRNRSFRHHAFAAMLATGAEDFRDIIEPVLSGQGDYTARRAYRLSPDLRLSSLGPNWRHQTREWPEEARADFISEMLHPLAAAEIAAFAAEDTSSTVKEAALYRLMWTGLDDLSVRVLESMDAQTFEDIARRHSDRIPAALRSRCIAALRQFVESTLDHAARLRTALDLTALGEAVPDDTFKESLDALIASDARDLERYARPALKHLFQTDPAWVSEWVATQIAEGVFYEREHWLAFLPEIPEGMITKRLQQLESEELRGARLDGTIELIISRVDSRLAARVFSKLRALRQKIDAEPGEPHELDRRAMRQLEALFRRLPNDIVATGVLASVTGGDLLDIKIASWLLTRVARPDLEPFRIANNDHKSRLLAYLKSGLDIVLHQDDFDGDEKANLASAIAQVGDSNDLPDLLALIRADIQRVRRGRAARATGDRGPLSNGGGISYARWHIDALMHLDPNGAVQVLIDLLPEPEYLPDVAEAMAQDFLPKPQRSFDRAFRYDLLWAAREDRLPLPGEKQRRTRFAAALNAEIYRLQEHNQSGKHASELATLAKALAAIDSRGSATTVQEVIAVAGEWLDYPRLVAAERLLVGGAIVPTNTACALVDSILERTNKWMQDSDRGLLCRMLALCPFGDDPAAGIAKMRDALHQQRLRGYELRELVIALGESRSDAATDLLCEMASDARTFEQCEEDFINAFAALDTSRAREVLLALVDPNVRSIALARRPRREDLLATRLMELAQRNQETRARLRDLCERDLSEFNRDMLSRVMYRLGTPDALAANLSLIDDAKSTPVPNGMWDHIRTAFVEQQPYREVPNSFTEHGRVSNELRTQLFRMAIEDERRRKSAAMLLGQIEEWRLEHGRPTGEPRHPDLASGQHWPPTEHP